MILHSCQACGNKVSYASNILCNCLVLTEIDLETKLTTNSYSMLRELHSIPDESTVVRPAKQHHHERHVRKTPEKVSINKQTECQIYKYQTRNIMKHLESCNTTSTTDLYCIYPLRFAFLQAKLVWVNLHKSSANESPLGLRDQEETRPPTSKDDSDFALRKAHRMQKAPGLVSNQL